MACQQGTCAKEMNGKGGPRTSQRLTFLFDCSIKQKCPTYTVTPTVQVIKYNCPNFLVQLSKLLSSTVQVIKFNCPSY